MQSDLVSIITPVYNATKFIGETILSVLNQSYQNWELILVNDCSKDDSLAIINSYAEKDKRVIVINHIQNMGVAAARNTGTKIAKGKYISFLDSDDCWDEGKLLQQVTFMDANELVLSHTAYRKINELGKVINPHIKVNKHIGYNGLLKHNEIGLLTSMYNVNLLGKLYFKKIGHEDFAFWLQILKKGYMSYGINDVLASYRVHGHSLSSNKIKSASYSWNIYRNVEKLSLMSSLYYFTAYAINSSLKFLRK